MLRKANGKGRNDDTCRGIVRQVRDAADSKAAFWLLATSLDATEQTVSGLLRHIGRNEDVKVDELAALDKAITDAAAKYDDDGNEIGADTVASDNAAERAKIEAETKATAIAAILSGIGRRGEDLAFTSADYAAIVAALLPHIHGEALDDTIAAAQAYAIGDMERAAAA